MSGKSRRGRGKPQARKRKSSQRFDLARQRSSAMAVQQPAIAQASKPASPPGASAPSVSVPTPVAKPAMARYPYVAIELQRIGILAGIILVILVVLALTLS